MDSTGGQSAVITGPSLAAANLASQAQVNATQQASEVAAANTSAAINALMGEYGTAYQMQAPVAGASLNATSQLNYMLGLNPLAPGAAPTAPTAPTLSSLESGISQSDINSYISQHSIMGPSNVFGYNGAGAVANPGTADLDTVNAFENANRGYQYSGGDQGQGLLNLSQQPGIQSAVTQALAQQQLDNPNSTANMGYNTANTAYQQQQAAYNQAQDLYNQYTAKGPATSADVNAIISNQPGYQFAQQQGINTIQNAAGATGGLNSSNLLNNLNTFGQGLAGQYYQNYLGNLATEAGLGQNATNALSTGAQNTGNSIAGLLSGLGTTQANAALAAGQAQATSYTSPAVNQQMISQNLGGGSSGLGSLLGGVGGLLGSQYSGSTLAKGLSYL